MDREAREMTFPGPGHPADEDGQWQRSICELEGQQGSGGTQLSRALSLAGPAATDDAKMLAEIGLLLGLPEDTDLSPATSMGQNPRSWVPIGVPGVPGVLSEGSHLGTSESQAHTMSRPLQEG